MPDSPNATHPSGHASTTALAVAALRAVHQTLDGEPKILDDPIAALLLGEDGRRMIETQSGRAAEPDLIALRSHVVLRSRYAEERLAEAVQRGVSQCVSLGAGLDSFAYRQPDWARRLRIYEVDRHGSQAEKRRRLQQAGVLIPPNLEFVAIDFESVSLDDGLRASSLDFSQATFFSCLGVLVYLSRDAVDAVFELVARCPAGSEIVFTFSTRERARCSTAEKVAALGLGEPWRTHFEPEALIGDLRALGFSEILLLDAEHAERCYFYGRSDGLHAPPRAGIAAAIVGAGPRR